MHSNIRGRRSARFAPRAYAGILSALVATFVAWAPTARGADLTLVGSGAAWKYLDDGSDQGTAWRAASFNDSGWQSGNAQLGYGDGDEATVVGFGPDADNKFITTYFRRSFNVADPSAFTGLTLRVLRDDGAVVYLNGTEVWRTNMPAGAISYTTAASSAVAGADESAFFQTTLNPAPLVSGTNLIAVEIHQSGRFSSDISFDLELTGHGASSPPSVTRGPYLQMGSPTGMVVRWRTDQATNGRVRYGTSQGNLNLAADDASIATDHQVTLSGLSPDTPYFYSVGTTAATLAGGDAGHFFITSPQTGSAKPTRIWVLGDSGTANANARAVRDAYLSFTGAAHTNLWLMLGDNAYDNGMDSEYQAAVFNTYPTMLRKSVLWPTIGNHDTAGSANPPAGLPYYSIFTLPANAEAGGIASGTEDYYSFDYANIHFVCLDSMTSDRTASGPMMTWLENDLASTSQQWIIAYWHHPPYSRGSHNSDTELNLVEMRQNALPILEAYGVDLVLAGHSHSYERSFLINGHYGASATFNDGMKRNGGDGRPDGNGAYMKATPGPAAHEGAVYAVAGSSGQISGGLLNHPAMFISLNSLGSLVLDINGNRLDAKFLRETGAVADHFTIIKGATACTFSVAPTSHTFTMRGGEGSVNVSSPAGCNWTAASNDNWVAITSASGGSGNASIGFQVRENLTGAPRSGSLTAAGTTITINQSGATQSNCSFSISPSGAVVASVGGTGSLNVTTSPHCIWAAASNAAWVTITSGASRVGSGAVGYSVAANNTGAVRKAKITIAGKTFSIKQRA